VRDSRTPWVNTTHDWAAAVDHEHLAQIRRQPARYAPGGVEHLILEVLACAADEAESSGRAGRGIVTVYADGSVSVADDGRGTDTRVDAGGRVIKKPGAMALAMTRAGSWPHLRVELVDERQS
jgi:topoisomerase-4 subunit B